MNLESSLALCAAVHAGALMLWFGGLSLGRIGAAPDGAGRRAARIAAAVALGTGVVWPLLQAGVVFDDAAAAIDPDRIGQVLAQTSFGRTWLLREGLVALALAAGSLGGLPAGRAAYALVATALASVALLGHAAGVAGWPGTVQRLALALHLLAAGAWIGALPLLWTQAGRLPERALVQALQRFSRFGIVLVAIVVVTGAASAWWRIGAFDVLAAGDYGRILAAKVGLVAFMGVAAVLNRNRFTPALESPDAARRAGARHALRGSIGIEAALGAGVLFLAFVLGSSDAPR
jgi:putative copper resistance protein D